MSSKRLKANRFRYDRNRIQNQIRKEAGEPFMDIADKEMNEELNRQEPSLDLNQKQEESQPEMKTEDLGDRTVAQSVSENSDNSTLTEEQGVFSQQQDDTDRDLKLGDIKIQDEDPLLDSVFAESDSTQKSEQSTVLHSDEVPSADENAFAQGISEASADTATLQSNDSSSDKTLLDEDPDRVPVAPSLRDDEVPNRPGAILLHAREILGLPLSEVARKLNLRVNTVSDLEHDRLNQPTAVPFASVHIANYAKLVNIDPDYLVDLYKKGVEQVVREQELTSKIQRKSQPHSVNTVKILSIVIAVALIAVIAVGVIAYNVGSRSARSSGALVLEDTVTAVENEEGMLTVDTENSKLKTEVVEEPSKTPVDMNTQMALYQAQDIDTANIINKLQTEEKAVTQTSQDSLKVRVNSEQELQAQNVEAADTQIDNPLRTVNLNSSLEEPVQKAKSVADSVKAEPVKTQSVKEETPKKEVAVRKHNEAPMSSTSADSNAVKKETEKKTPVVLSNTLKDISSSARLSGRIDPLESLNSVTIRVTGDVALKINANGKLLKQGAFKSGDVIKVSGIPPIRVSVSDTSKVRITYRGTAVSVPKTSQASFVLPQK
ncbi:MAG: helix-turn-helix domain-containing protein [Succinivibrio sp.]